MEVKEEKQAECLQMTVGFGDGGKNGRWETPDITPNNVLLNHVRQGKTRQNSENILPS